MKFVVLTDMSENSRPLLQFAHKTAANANATLLVVHQSTLPVPAMGDSESLQSIKNENKNRSLGALMEYVADTVNIDTPIEYKVTTGNLQAFIYSMENSTDFDLVFVGVKHKGLVEKILVGNTVTKLANEISRIIVAIPEGQTAPDVSTLYVAVKKEYDLNEAELHKCINAFRNSTTRVHLFSMLTPSEDETPTTVYLEKIISGLPAGVAAGYELQRTVTPHKHIKEFMRGNTDGILVIQKGPRTLADIFRKYFVNDLVDDTQLPVIILP